MVVDIRYHLASLVAVFLALGLGILVGTSLSGGEARQEAWLSSLERELSELQLRRTEMAARLASAEQERDLYVRFADSVREALSTGALSNERAAVVVLGDDRSGLDSVREALKQAGAQIVRTAHVRSSWNDRTDHFLALLTPDAPRAKASAGALLASAIAGNGSDLFTTIDSPTLWLEATSAEPATLVTFLVDDSDGAYVSLFSQAVEALEASNVQAAVVAIGGNERWQRLAVERGVPYVAHWQSPLGRLSLVHLISQHEAGVFGLGEDLSAWPDQLLSTLGELGRLPKSDVDRGSGK